MMLGYYLYTRAIRAIAEKIRIAAKQLLVSPIYYIRLCTEFAAWFLEIPAGAITYPLIRSKGV